MMNPVSIQVGHTAERLPIRSITTPAHYVSQRVLLRMEVVLMDAVRSGQVHVLIVQCLHEKKPNVTTHAFSEAY